MKKKKTGELKKMIVELRAMNERLDEAGGPSADGRLFEEIIEMEGTILTAAGLPETSQNCLSLFSGSVEDALLGIETAREEYEARPIRDHALLVLAEAQAGRDDPFTVLPMIGSRTHVYTLFLFSRKLMNTVDPEEIDTLLRELRLADKHLGALGKVIIGGILKNRKAYTRLKGLGFSHLDECLAEEGTFDLPEEEMDTAQLLFFARRAGSNGRAPDAARLCTRAIELDDHAEGAYYMRALAREDLSDMDGAFDDYSRSILVNPALYAAYVNRSRIHAMRGCLQEAALDCSAAIEFYAGDAFAYVNRGNAFAALGHFVEAAHDFGIALQLGLEEDYVYVNRAMANLSLGKREEALGDLLKGHAMGSELAGKALEEFFGVSV